MAQAFGPLEPDGKMISGAIAQNPSLETLFGSQDIAKWMIALSILSPLPI